MNPYLKAIIVAIVWGAFATFGMLLITSEYYDYNALTGDSNLLRGVDALKAMINSFGWAEIRKNFLGYYLIVISIIFVGCVVYGKWLVSHDR